MADLYKPETLKDCEEAGKVKNLVVSDFIQKAIENDDKKVMKNNNFF